MTGEFPPLGDDESHNRSSFEVNLGDQAERYLELYPIIDCAYKLLESAISRDDLLDHAHDGQNVVHRVRSAGNENFNFTHDRIEVVPFYREGDITLLRIRFSVPPSDDNLVSGALFITSLNRNNEVIEKVVLTDSAIGLYDKNIVKPDAKDRKLRNVIGLEHDPIYVEKYSKLLKSAQLKYQTNESEAA